MRFQFGADLLEHHPLHNLQISTANTSLDGQEVLLVTHPAVVAYGDAEGENYATRTVLKRAVVWMGG